MKLYDVMLEVRVVERGEIHDGPPEEPEDIFAIKPGEDPLARAGKMMKAIVGATTPGVVFSPQHSQVTASLTYQVCASDLGELHRIIERFDALGKSLGMPAAQ